MPSSFSINKVSRLIFITGILLCSSVLWSESSRGVPHVSRQAISIPDAQLALKKRAMLPQATVKIKGLRAVLIGAPIDGDLGSKTQKEVANLRLAAAELRKNSVTVYEFYTPENQWAKIRQRARGAHFLLYRGHGVYDGKRPPKWVGGFSLSQNFVTADQLRRDLKLAHGAIVMLYGCFTAGNAGFDIGQIDQNEAARRVAMYSEPFISNHFAGYYANWYGDAFQYYIAWLFAGKSLGDSWKAYHNFEADSSVRMPYPGQSDQVLWLEHDDWQNQRVFNNAFAGQADQTLVDLFSEPSSFAKFRKWIMN